MGREIVHTGALLIPIHITASPTPETTMHRSNNIPVPFDPTHPQDAPPTTAATPSGPPMDVATATKQIGACAVPLGLPPGAPIAAIVDAFSDACEALQAVSPAAQASRSKALAQLTASQRDVCTKTATDPVAFLAARSSLGWKR
jgi:hypothetical protein